MKLTASSVAGVNAQLQEAVANGTLEAIDEHPA